MAEFVAKNIFATYLIGGSIAVTVLMLLPLGSATFRVTSAMPPQPSLWMSTAM